MFESAGIMSHCRGWVVGKWLVCVAFLKVCVGFVEVVLGVHDANAHAFIKEFHFDRVVNSKVL